MLSEDREADKNLVGFEESVFQAALDAERQRPWARNSEGGAPERWWSTQRRYLELALELTGISRTIAERTRQRISTVLAVPLLVIQEASRTELRGYQQRGAAVAKILALVQPSRSRALRFLLVGHLTGRWGRPRSSNPRSRSLEDLPFYVGGTPAPT